MKNKILRFIFLLSIFFIMPFFTTGCGSSSEEQAADHSDYIEPTGTGSRDNTSICLIPEAPELDIYSNELICLDCSNASEGYIMAKYLGTCEKVRLQITCPNTSTYSYLFTKNNEYETFPLTTDSGLYSFTFFENIAGTQYSTAFKADVDINIINTFGPYLYPNQYVNFTEQSPAIAKAKELATPANNDLDVVSNVYNYVLNKVSYDYEKAKTVQSGYIPSVDDTFQSLNGICLDYASLMAAMLRSQRIPTHMEVGYAGEVYHAWISTYITDTGWVNGIIEFDGTNWQLMDPTFASNNSQKALKEFIGDGHNYETKFVY